jgi:predicted DCC family thiol-disulfide oxidoreductase YuxK
MPKSILIYDGDCGFCKRWIKRWQKITGDAIDYAPYQAVHAQYPQIPITQFQKAVQFVESSGQFYSGAYAVAK